jgi:predicted transcriptional regulator
MEKMKATVVRLSSVQRAQLSKLAKKLQVNQSNVIRLAIARLAEQEGITPTSYR